MAMTIYLDKYVCPTVAMRVRPNYIEDTLSGEKVNQFPADFTFQYTRLIAVIHTHHVILYDTCIAESSQNKEHIQSMCQHYLSMGYELYWYKYPSRYVSKHFQPLIGINSANWYDALPISFTQSVDRIFEETGGVSIKFKTPIECVRSQPNDTTIPHVKAVIVN
jgi:hypothetical protein